MSFASFYNGLEKKYRFFGEGPFSALTSWLGEVIVRMDESPKKKAEAAVTSGEPAVGDKMPDGTIFAGISPDTNKPMYVTAEDATMSMDFNAAAKYAKKLKAHGHNDWRVPSKAELNVLFQNREKGALKGALNLTGSLPDGWYWSSSFNYYSELRQRLIKDDCPWRQHFKKGYQKQVTKDGTASVRCVR
jgi:hypothetical protein